MRPYGRRITATPVFALLSAFLGRHFGLMICLASSAILSLSAIVAPPLMQPPARKIQAITALLIAKGIPAEASPPELFKFAFAPWTSSAQSQFVRPGKNLPL